MGERYKIQYTNHSRTSLAEGMSAISFEHIPMHFVVYPVTGRDLLFMSKVEPGIFVTGGSARAMALKEICHIPEREILPPTDIDWITLGNRHIHVRQTLLKNERRKIPLKSNMLELLSAYCDETDFGVDGLFVGRFSPNDEPNIYLTYNAHQNYVERRFDFGINFKGVERNNQGQVVHIVNDKVALRAILLGLRLKEFGFSNKITDSLIKEALNRNWAYLLEDGVTLDYISRAKNDGLLDEYLNIFKRLGFTVSNTILQCINSHTRPQVVDKVLEIQKKVKQAQKAEA